MAQRLVIRVRVRKDGKAKGVRVRKVKKRRGLSVLGASLSI